MIYLDFHLRFWTIDYRVWEIQFGQKWIFSYLPIFRPLILARISLPKFSLDMALQCFHMGQSYYFVTLWNYLVGVQNKHQHYWVAQEGEGTMPSKLSHLLPANYPISIPGTLSTTIFCHRVIICQSLPHGILLSIDIHTSATRPLGHVKDAHCNISLQWRCWRLHCNAANTFIAKKYPQ